MKTHLTILSFTSMLTLWATSLHAETPSGTTQQKASPGQVPEGLAKSDWSNIRVAYEAGRHAFQPTAAGWEARNPGQQWITKFDGRGFIAEPRDGGWTWGLELQCYGFGEDQHAIGGTPAVKAEGQRLSYQWDATVQEWWVNDQRGLEHGFTVKEWPDENPASKSQSPSPPLSLTLRTRGTLHPRISADAQGVLFHNASGVNVLNYTGLKVWDADGKVLPSHFEAAGEMGLRVIVNEQGARYPLTIDPIVQQAYLKQAGVGSWQAADNFGHSVGISGDTVVVGAPGDDGIMTTDEIGIPRESDTDSGAAYVFVRSAGVWTQQAYLKPAAFGTWQIGDGFGISVAISGDTVVVGAYGEDSSTTGVNSVPNDPYPQLGESGAAFVFVRNAGVWTQQAYLKPAAVGSWQAGDNFGTSVAISGDTVVVGAPAEDSGTTGVNSTPNESAGGAGAVYVFVRSAGMWAQQAYLKPSAFGTTQWGDAFGGSVAISGDTVVIGAPGEDSRGTGVNSPPNESANDAGAAYVFARSAGVWTQQAYLKPAAVGLSPVNDYFGGAVAISGDTVAIGAVGESSSTTGVNSTAIDSPEGRGSGAVYIFVRNAGVWTQQAYLKPAAFGTSQSEDQFGKSVAVSGDTVVVGAFGESSSTTGVNSTADEGARFSGAAYVFVRSAGVWTQQAFLKPAAVGTSQVEDQFGNSVAVSGDMVIIGALAEDSGTTGVNSTPNESAGGAGAAYIFNGLDSGTSVDQDRDGLPDFVETYFGTSLIIPNGAPLSVEVAAGQASLRWSEANPSGVTVTPQWSPDLFTWLASGESANGIPARTLTITSPVAGQMQAALSTTGLPHASLRLKLTQP